MNQGRSKGKGWSTTNYFKPPPSKSRKENPQKLTQLSSRSHPRHLVGKRTAQKDITIDTTSDSQVNSNFPNRWSPASLLIFIAGRPKAALLFWFFGDFRCGALLFMVIHVIYKYKIGKNSC